MESHGRNNPNLVSTSLLAIFLCKIDLKDKCFLREDANACPFTNLTLLQFSLSYRFSPQWCRKDVVCSLGVSNKQEGCVHMFCVWNIDIVDSIIQEVALLQLKTKGNSEGKTDFNALNAKKAQNI